MGSDEFCAEPRQFITADSNHVSFQNVTSKTALLPNEVLLFGQRLQLLDDKALYLPEVDTLLVSDVHLGKAETFQSFGMKRIWLVCERSTTNSCQKNCLS